MTTTHEYYSYVYRITNLTENKHYYGSRYSKMEYRYSYNAIEDLMSYKTSSSDNEFKFLLENYISDPSTVKIKILKTFNNANDAINYESKLHYKFDVENNPSFYNKNNQEPYNKKYLNYKIYNLENNKQITVEEICLNSGNFNVTYRKIIRLFHGINIVLGKYCKVYNTFDTIKWYKTQNSLVTLYKIENNKVIKYTDLYKNWINNTRISFESFNRPHCFCCCGYYLSYDKCLEELERTLKTLTLYKYNEERKVVEEILIKHTDGTKLLGSTFTSIYNEDRISVNGYYKNREQCEYANRSITLYKYNLEINDIETFSGPMWYISKTLFNRPYIILQKNAKTIMGCYFSFERCKEDYSLREKFYYDICTHKINKINYFKKDNKKVLGRSEEESRQIYYGKYYVNLDDCILHNTRLKILNTETNIITFELYKNIERYKRDTLCNIVEYKNFKLLSIQQPEIGVDIFIKEI